MPDGALIDAAVLAVAEASAVCRHVQRGQDAIRALTKDDRSPVTVADFASQAVVARRLREALGPVRLLAEENADALREADQAPALERVIDAARIVWPEADATAVLDAIDAGNDDATAETYWTLDPIDGTKGFLRGGQYAVSLALVENASPALGALGCPNLAASFDAPFDVPDGEGRIYLAVAGDGVRHGGTAARSGADLDTMVRPAHAGNGIRVAESVEAAHSKHDAVTMVLDAVGGGADSLRLDSQAKYAVVARGQADAYLRMPTRKGYVERIWDHAAGSIVATEAGCVVTDITGLPLDFGHGAGLERNRGIVCADRGLHERLIGAIRELGDTLGLPGGVGPM